MHCTKLEGKWVGLETAQYELPKPEGQEKTDAQNQAAAETPATALLTHWLDAGNGTVFLKRTALLCFAQPWGSPVTLALVLRGKRGLSLPCPLTLASFSCQKYYFQNVKYEFHTNTQ